jgi:polysaccharide export outer membrane protein
MPIKRPAWKLNRSIDGLLVTALIMRLFRQKLCRYVSALCPLALAVVLTACGTTPAPNDQAKKLSPEEVERVMRTFPLRVGDKVRVELSGIPDKLDPYDREVKEDGTINLPYIDDIAAAGKSPSQLEIDITAAYTTKGIYTHINVTVTPTARFFYVMGQVNNNAGGRIPYVGPITVLDAIAAAADFTAFADRRHVQITRVNGKIDYVNCVKALKHPELNLQVYPGDRITVPRRAF